MTLKDWTSYIKDQEQQAYYQALQNRISQLRATHRVFPAPEEVFAALDLTPFDQVKVVILGQDPYPTFGHAQGLSFSVRPGVALPKSLRNMFVELESDLGIPIAKQGDLTAWAKQGVLLLNTVLTVNEGQAHSHKGLGWEIFTDGLIQALNDRDKPVVFVLWGKAAQAKEALITHPQHRIIKSAHPSPLSAYRGFFGSKPYSQINQALVELGQTPIDWRIDL